MRRAPGVIEHSTSSAAARDRAPFPQRSQACRAIGSRTRPSTVSTSGPSRST